MPNQNQGLNRRDFIKTVGLGIGALETAGIGFGALQLTGCQGNSPAYKSRGYAVGAARVYGSYPFTDVSSQAYNAELVVQLTPVMQSVISQAGTAL